MYIHSCLQKVYVSLTWSIFQLQCLLMSAKCLAAVLVLLIRLILSPTEIHCQAFHRAATQTQKPHYLVNKANKWHNTAINLFHI